MSTQPLVVLKLGGSVLVGDGSLPLAVAEIHRHLRAGERVVAVVSAQAGATDALLERARDIAPRPDPSLLAAFVSCGEGISSAALALAADAARIPTTLLTPHELGLQVSAHHPDPELVALPSTLLRHRLRRHPLVVVPGFAGLDAAGALWLLGRGGSDLTAIFLAAELGARCILIKDVDGWFTDDPRIEPQALRFRTLHWDDAVSRPSPIVQARAVRTARATGTRFLVRSWGSRHGTRVGPEPTVCESVPAAVAQTPNEPASCR